MEETQKCPYCGEEILATAKKCKHCGEWLEEAQSDQKASQQNDSQEEVDTTSSENVTNKCLYKISNKTAKIIAMSSCIVLWIFIACTCSTNDAKVTLVQKLPNTEEWQFEFTGQGDGYTYHECGQTYHVDLGIMADQTSILWSVPLWNENVRYVLYHEMSSENCYVDLTNEEVAEYFEIYDEPTLSSWDVCGGKMVYVLSLVVVLVFLYFKKYV